MRILILIVSLSLFFATCSSEKIVQPESSDLIKANSKKSYVTDSLGAPLGGVAISMYLLCDQDLISEQTRYVSKSYAMMETVLTRLRIFNMFDKEIKMLSCTLECYRTSCTTTNPYRWDQTDFNGDTVPVGLYYINEIREAFSRGAYDSTTGKSWLYFNGSIGVSDSNGQFIIPPVPVNKNIAIYGSLPIGGYSGQVKRYNGWFCLTYEKKDYETLSDTLFFGSSTIIPVKLNRIN